MNTSGSPPVWLIVLMIAATTLAGVGVLAHTFAFSYRPMWYDWLGAGAAFALALLLGLYLTLSRRFATGKAGALLGVGVVAVSAVLTICMAVRFADRM